MKKPLALLLLTAAVSVSAFGQLYTVLVNTNGMIVAPTNLWQTLSNTAAAAGAAAGAGSTNAVTTNYVNAAVANSLLTASNSFAGVVPMTNFTTVILSAAGYTNINGTYPYFDGYDLTNGNCFGGLGGNIYIIAGGTNLQVGITTHAMEIDDYSGAVVNIYYATNFSTNIAAVQWFAASTNYLPIPNFQYVIATNLALGLGPVASAQVNTQIVASLISGGSNVEAGLYSLPYPPEFAGSGLTNTAPTGPSIWTAWSTPQIVIYVAPYALNTEQMVTNVINSLVAMPQFAQITNSGIGFTLELDVNSTYRHNSSGVLQWNYTLFPDGPTFLTALCASNGISTVCAIYGDTTVHLPFGAAGAVCSVSGGSQHSVTFYSGSGGSMYGTNWSDCALPEQIPTDLATIQSWGFNAVQINDLGTDITLQEQYQLESEVGTVCSYLRNANSTPFGYLAFDTPPSQAFGRSCGNYTRALHTVFNLDQVQPDAEYFLRDYMQDFQGCPVANQGAWCGNNPFVSALPGMTVNALISGWECPILSGSSILTFTNHPALTLATNKTWQSIENDPLLKLPVKIQDYGTNGSVWLKQMVNGSFALGVFNGNINMTNLTFSLPASWQTSAGYIVSNVWQNTSAGLLSNSFTATNLTARGTSNSAALFICHPNVSVTNSALAALSQNNGNGLTNLNATALSSGFLPQNVLSNVVGAITVSGPGSVGIATNAYGGLTAAIMINPQTNTLAAPALTGTLPTATLPASVTQASSNVVTSITVNGNASISYTTNTTGIAVTVTVLTPSILPPYLQLTNLTTIGNETNYDPFHAFTNAQVFYSGGYSNLLYSPAGVVGWGLLTNGGFAVYGNENVMGAIQLFGQNAIQDKAAGFTTSDTAISAMTGGGIGFFIGNKVAGGWATNSVFVSTNGYEVAYVTPIGTGIPSNSIPSYTGTATNWWIGSYNGTVAAICTNLGAGTFTIKQLAP